MPLHHQHPLRWVLVCAVLAPLAPAQSAKPPAAQCSKPPYLRFDTGHMEVAPLIAKVLACHQVKAIFFAANQATKTGNSSLGERCAPWWRERAPKGHAFASHTFDHVYWRADAAKGSEPWLRTQPSAGVAAGKTSTLTAAQYCAQIKQSADRLQVLTQQPALPLFRAPGGKTSPALLAAARSCGYAHLTWADAGFMSDKLPSDKYPNKALLNRASRDLRSGDILMAHLGIWSRKGAWQPAVLEPLIMGLQAKGFCFETLHTHPAYQSWIVQHQI